MDEKKFCPHCGKELEEGAAFCPNCGAKVSEDTQGTYESGTNSNSYSTFDVDSKKSNSSDTNSMLTLVFGILSICLGGIIWVILALVFASKADKSDTKTKVGKGLAIAGLVIWGIVLVILIIWAVVMASAIGQY